MAFRGGIGRGRGRGGGGGKSFDNPPAQPFVIFPEITLPDPKSISNDAKLVSSYYGFENFWRNSPYHLGDGVLKKENESLDIERFSDSVKPKTKSTKTASFYDFLVLRPDNFPKELLQDAPKERSAKKLKWSQKEAELQKLDVFEKLEAKYKAEGKEENEEVEDEVEESDGEESDNGDYDQNQDFDDDEDDYNQEEVEVEDVVY